MTVYPNVIFPALDFPTRGRQGQRGPKTGETDWTEARVATLREMWAAGKTVTDIMLALGLNSRGAVSGKCARLGLSREKPPPSPRRGYRSEKQADPGAYISRVAMPEGRLFFEDLSEDVCHFPVGDPPFLFCGGDTDIAPYCPTCSAIAHPVFRNQQGGAHARVTTGNSEIGVNESRLPR